MSDHSDQQIVILTNIGRLKEVEGKEKYRVEVSNRFAGLEDFDAEVEIERSWETARKYIKIAAERSTTFLTLCNGMEIVIHVAT
jgi:hypothetical protein